MLINSESKPFTCTNVYTFGWPIGSIFISIGGKVFRTYPTKNLKGIKHAKGLEQFAHCWLVKVTPTDQNRANLIWRQHGSNTTILWQNVHCQWMYCKAVHMYISGWCVTMRGFSLGTLHVHFPGSGLSPWKEQAHPGKKWPVHLTFTWLTLRVVFGSRMKPFGDFLARNTSYYRYSPWSSTVIGMISYLIHVICGLVLFPMSLDLISRVALYLGWSRMLLFHSSSYIIMIILGGHFDWCYVCGQMVLRWSHLLILWWSNFWDGLICGSAWP